MPTRRAILTTAGATAVVAGLGAAGWATYPGLGRARAPWSAAGESFGDPRLDALAFAILAPNPHNRQPWVFTLVGEDTVEITCDLSRRLPQTDPFDRQIVVGFGAMTELLRMAAAEKGFAVEIEPFSEGEPQPRLDSRPLARAQFIRDETISPDPLFAHALARRTTRAPYDQNRPVSYDTVQTVARAAAADAEGAALTAAGTVDDARAARLKTIAARAWEIEWSNAPTRRESIEVMRISNREIDATPDGLALGGTGMGLLKMAGLVSREGMDQPGSLSYDAGLNDYLTSIDTAMGFVWLLSADNARATQLAAGRAWVRMNLAAQDLGLAIQPLSQALQEFPEMAEPYAAIHDALGADEPEFGGNGVVQMFARVGYAAFPEPSPRWPLESKLAQAPA
jgi:hypothetical protein